MVMKEERSAWLGLMATTTADTLQALREGAGISPDYTMLRPRETGAVRVLSSGHRFAQAFRDFLQPVGHSHLDLSCHKTAILLRYSMLY